MRSDGGVLSQCLWADVGLWYGPVIATYRKHDAWANQPPNLFRPAWVSRVCVHLGVEGMEVSVVSDDEDMHVGHESVIEGALLCRDSEGRKRALTRSAIWCERGMGIKPTLIAFVGDTVDVESLDPCMVNARHEAKWPWRVRQTELAASHKRA